MDKDFLLKAYGQCWGPEAGEWNTSVENKYLEYMFAKFFEDNFIIQDDYCILNIGIGAGYWDRYLSFKVPKGELCSVDIDREICRQLSESLVNEENPNQVTVICADALRYDFKRNYDIVTVVGSTAGETGNAEMMTAKAISLIKDKGALYLQMLHKGENFDIERICHTNKATIEASLIDDTYDIHAEYYKIIKGK